MTYRGTIYGSTIELETNPGMPDGQAVEIEVRVPQCSGAWGEGIRRSAGVAADVPGADEVFDQLAHQRRTAQFRESAE